MKSVTKDYSIDEYGNVYNKKTGLKLKQYKRKDNYYQIILHKENKKCFLVHRLVAEAFIPNPDNLPEVNHKDRNRGNNHKDNLEWCTHRDNVKHAFTVGTIKRKNQNGELNEMSKLTESEVKQIRLLYDTGNYTQKELGINFNVARQTIGDIINYKRWKHI